MYRFLALCLLLTACTTSFEGPNPLGVRHAGALKNIMHKGDLSAHAKLSEFAAVDHLWALGAVAGLKGEVLILDGAPYVSSVNGAALEVDTTFGKSATLLVYAEVEAWNASPIPASVKNDQQLQDYLSKAASEAGIATDAPFPFRITGTAAAFDWHVINWPEGDTEHSHEKHITSGLHGTKRDQEVEILGFYSNRHHAIFTHHTTNLHMHVKTADNQLCGHVDGLELGQGMVLYLPKDVGN